MDGEMFTAMAAMASLSVPDSGRHLSSLQPGVAEA